MMKRLLVFIVAIMGYVGAWAYSFMADGIAYDIISANKVSVTYTSSSSNNYSGLSGNITIPSQVTYNSVLYQVTSIGDEAFDDCSGLTSVTIPNGVTSIGDYAFDDCSGLTSVTIPSSVTSIGQMAFSGCSGLTSVNVKVSDYSAFISNNVSNLVKTAIRKPFVLIDESGNEIKNYVIPNDITAIGNAAFCNCSGLTSVTIPNSVTSIGDEAFYGCSGLTSVTIPNSVTSIGVAAFFDCSGLTSVTIGNSVTSIDASAFGYCSGLTSVTIPSSVTSIGDGAFYGCSGLTSVTIGNSVTFIGAGAFYGTAWYDNQPEGLLYIGRVAYQYKGTMPANTSIAIKDGTVSISSGAFSDCSSLTSVTIPNSVTSIEQRAFYSCI